ncbi:MAG TPA: glutaredoxin 3 [Pseudomonadales bacterium]|nr:glutaredoxin 3 [Pseudomonadales bacterium]
MSSVLIYTTPFCPYCIRAKHLLSSKGVSFTEINVALDRAKRVEMEQKSGRRTVPQIWIGERHVGGCDDLYELERRGELNTLLGLTS